MTDRPHWLPNGELAVLSSVVEYGPSTLRLTFREVGAGDHVIEDPEWEDVRYEANVPKEQGGHWRVGAEYTLTFAAHGHGPRSS